MPGNAIGSASCPFTNASRDFRPYDLADPFPFYEFARHEAPVFFSEELKYYVVARHADVSAVFEDWRTFSSENAQAPMRPLGEEAPTHHARGRFHRLFRPLRPRAARTHPHAQDRAGTCFGPRRFKAIEPQHPRDRQPARSTLSSRAAMPISSAISLTTCRRWCCSVWSASPTATCRRSRPGHQPRVADLGQSHARGADSARAQHGRILELLPRPCRAPA